MAKYPTNIVATDDDWPNEPHLDPGDLDEGSLTSPAS